MQPQNNGDPNMPYAQDPQPVGPPPAPVPQPIYDNLGNPVENTGQPQVNPYEQQFVEELAAEMPQEPVAPPPKPRAKPGVKKLIVSLVVALLFAGLIGGGVAAFTQYQKPERVAEDMLTHLLAAKYLQVDIDTDITFDKKVQEKMDIEIKGLRVAHRTQDATNQVEATLSVRYAEKDFDLKGSAIVEKTGDVYFRLDDVASQVDTWADVEFGAVLSDKAKNDLKKLEREWIKYGIDQMKKDAPDFAEAYVCQLEAVAKLSDDQGYRDEVVASYRLNPVLKTVGSAQYDGMTVGYEVEVDEDAYEKFSESLKNTDFGKKTSECAEKTAPLQPADEDSEATADEEGAAAGDRQEKDQLIGPNAPVDSATSEDVVTDLPVSRPSTSDQLLADGLLPVPEVVAETDAKPTMKATIWVDMVSHELKRIDSSIEYEGTGSAASKLRFGYDQQMTVDVPSDTINFGDWTKRIETAVKTVEEDIDKTRTKQSKSELEAAKTVSMTAEQVRERAEVFRDKLGRFPETADELEFAKLDLPTMSPMIVDVLPKAAGSVAYKKCSVGAQVVYRDINRNKYVSIGLGGVTSGDVTALCV